MSVVYCPLCLGCKYRIRENKPKGTPFCKAYPDGIPYDTWIEKSKHDIDENAPCANGFMFEKDEGKYVN